MLKGHSEAYSRERRIKSPRLALMECTDPAEFPCDATRQRLARGTHFLNYWFFHAASQRLCSICRDSGTKVRHHAFRITFVWKPAAVKMSIHEVSSADECVSISQRMSGSVFRIFAPWRTRSSAPSTSILMKQGDCTEFTRESNRSS